MSIIEQKLEALKEAEYKLVLIVGRPGTGKSKLLHEFSANSGIPVLDLNKILGEQIPTGKDADYVYGFLDGFLTTYNQPVVLLDKKRILYNADSNIDMLKFLKDISKNKFVVATWNGYVEDGKLIHIRSGQSNLEYVLDDCACATILL